VSLALLMQCLSLAVVLIAASCIETGIGGAYLDLRESLHSTKRGSVAHGHFWAKSENLFLENQ
jgi:hypothetical protein